VLDYDRLVFSDRETQLLFFRKQLDAFCGVSRLPLFLHCRNAFSDLYGKQVCPMPIIAFCRPAVLMEFRDVIVGGGVIHSFDGTLKEADDFVSLGYYIGLNGW
jgi:TatD DNase family protein